MTIKNAPFWWEEAPRAATQSPALPKSVDIAVIGAGYTGLCTALVLARSGASVAVFEAGDLGAGASTRNGGMVGPSFHKLGLAGLKAKFGKSRADAIIKESIGFVGFLEEFLKTEKIDADFARTGRFLGALKPADFDSMAREMDILKNTINVEGHMVEKKDQAAETGSNLFHGGMVFDRDGGLHPAKYHDGLVRRVQEAGALIFAQTPVVHIEKRAGSYQLKTSGGEITATNIAVCTNGYTKSVTQDLRKRVLPLRSAMIATDPLDPELLSQLMPKKRMYGDRRRLVAYYRPSPDGRRILFGGRATGLTEKPSANADLLRSSMLEVFPELSRHQISHSWSGLVAYSFDHVPHLGQFGGGKDDGMFYAMGYCGSGVARSTYFGTKLGHKILGSDQGRTAFDDLEFETRPFYTGNPWFMPGILAWHRLADRLGL